MRRSIPGKWPLVFYFVCRYSAVLNVLLSLLVWLAASQKGAADVDCRGLAKAAMVFNVLTVLSSSAILGIRTMAIYKFNRFIRAATAFLAIAQVALWVPPFVFHKGVAFATNTRTGLPSGFCKTLPLAEDRLWFSIAYGMALFVNLSYTVLSLIRIFADNRYAGDKKKSWPKVLGKQAMSYSFFVILFDIMVFVTQVVYVNQVFKYLIIVPCIMLISISSARLVIHISAYNLASLDTFFSNGGKRYTSKSSRVVAIMPDENKPSIGALETKDKKDAVSFSSRHLSVH